MKMDPASFTFEKLNELKFNDLYKMTVQFNLVKRRVKKQELIEKLLTLKNQSSLAEENEWKDGSVVFNNLNENKNDEESRRLTFNIEKNSDSDRRLTFEVPQDKSILFSSGDSRSTYEVPPNKKDIETDSRATFEISQKGKNFVSPPIVNSRETYEVPMSAKKLMEALGTNSRCEVHLEKLNMEKIDQNKNVKLDVIKEKKIKSPITRRTRRDGIVKDDNMKMSQKSILIKRTNKTATPNKTVEMMKSPFKPRVKLMNLQGSKTPLTKPKPKTLEGNTESVKKVPLIKPKADEDKLSEIKETEETSKENVGRLSRRRKSKTEDNAIVKKPNPIKVNFFSPQVANRLSRSRMSGQDPETRISKIPKPTKMPNFASIHKKQFEQMDSLHDYKRKKEERARKLFGTPQPGPQNKESAKKPVTGIFQFKSTKIDMKDPAPKFGRSIENLKNAQSPLKSKAMDSKAKKDAVKNKAPRVQTDIKDRNRSHIHGVRTNKRFELQMKFRNL